jgi:hypothetical protein
MRTTNCRQQLPSSSIFVVYRYRNAMICLVHFSFVIEQTPLSTRYMRHDR